MKLRNLACVGIVLGSLASSGCGDSEWDRRAFFNGLNSKATKYADADWNREISKQEFNDFYWRFVRDNNLVVGNNGNFYKNGNFVYLGNACDMLRDYEPGKLR